MALMAMLVIHSANVPENENFDLPTIDSQVDESRAFSPRRKRDVVMLSEISESGCFSIPHARKENTNDRKP